MSITLAIDQSTSSTKAMFFDGEGNVLDQAALEHRQHYPQPGWVEHDAEEIWQNLLAVVKTLVERNPRVIDETARVSITNQRETILAFDTETGEPVGNAIVWQCRRGDSLCAAMRAEGADALVRRKTGLKIDSYFSGSKMRWMLENIEGLAGRLAQGTARFATIDTYLIYRLTGGEVFATDATNASRTLLFDIGKLDWDPELCSLFCVPPVALAEVREPTARFGETTFGGMLEKPLCIQGLAGDSQASLFGQGCIQPGTAKVTIGTGSSLLLNIGGKRPANEGQAVCSLAWTHEGETTFALEGLINYAGGTVNWLRDQLGIIDTAEETGTMARELDGNGGVYLVPAFAGLSAPYWSSDARAAIIGMTGHSDKRHIVRAALESIAYQIRDVLDALLAEAPLPLQKLSADGGAIKNTFLMQFLADLLRIPVCTASAPEYSALGAARLGAWGAEDATSMAVAGSGECIYLPRDNEEEMIRCHNGWKSAVQRVL